MSRKPGEIYVRGNRLWVWWYDEHGRRRARSLGLGLEQRNEAEQTLAALARRVEHKRRLLESAGPSDPGATTVAGYRKRWIADRKRRGVASSKDDDARLEHVMPVLGSMEMAAVRPHHIRDLVRELKAKIGPRKEDMAPRSVRHVYFALRLMFQDAAIEETIPANPCVLKRGELPAKDDKDPNWRPTAKYRRAEVEQLISDERIPYERRVLYAVLFLGGMRIGEGAARRWSDYEPDVEPLGRLIIGSSFNRKEKRFKAPKGGRSREVPVHPTLAKVLAEWRLSGWERTYGRPPKDDDLLFVAARGGPLKDPTVKEQLNRDLATLGLRQRRTHDTRRTFISLCRDDGAIKETLRPVTHRPVGDQVDDYTTLSWAARCAEVAKLRIALREGVVLPLPVSATGTGYTAVTVTPTTENRVENLCPGRDSKAHTSPSRGVLHVATSGNPGDCASGVRAATDRDGAECNAVTAYVRAALAALAVPDRGRAADCLRRALGVLEGTP